MFVQATKSKRQNKTYVSYLVRESFRTSQGPRSRTVCNISALPPEVRELVAAALSGQTCVVLEQIELSRALDYGGLAVLRDAWQRFGLEKLFAEVPQVRQRRLLQAMIFGRILFPGAKLALGERAAQREASRQGREDAHIGRVRPIGGSSRWSCLRFAPAAPTLKLSSP